MLIDKHKGKGQLGSDTRLLLSVSISAGAVSASWYLALPCGSSMDGAALLVLNAVDGLNAHLCHSVHYKQAICNTIPR